MIRFSFVLACVGLWLSVTTTAYAQTSVVIVVPHSGTDDYNAYERRLRSELISEGFQPVSVEIQTEVSAPLLKQHANRLMSPAAISLSIRDRAISGWVWIESRGKGNDLLRAVPEYPLNAQAPQIFAVKAADVLHGGLLELGYIGTTPPETAPAARATALSPTPAAKASPPTPAKAPEKQPVPVEGKARSQVQVPSTEVPSSVSEPRTKSPPTPYYAWHVRGLLSLIQTVNGSPLEMGATLSATYSLSAQLGVGLTGTYLGSSNYRTEPFRGEADVTEAALAPRLELRQPISKRACIFESVEAGAHAVFVAGQAAAPNFVAHHASSWTAYASPALGLDVKLAGRLSSTFQASFLYPLRKVDIVVSKTRVFEAAVPAVLLSAGFELNL